MGEGSRATLSCDLGAARAAAIAMVAREAGLTTTNKTNRTNRHHRKLNKTKQGHRSMGGKGKGKAFVRPGAIARYVDAQKISNQYHFARNRRSLHSANVKVKVKAVPDVDITRKSRCGKRVRSYLSDEKQQLKIPPVPTPRGIHHTQAKKASRSGVRKVKVAGGPPRNIIGGKLLSLPNDILTRVLCCLKHKEMKGVSSVCKTLGAIAQRAITSHFNFLTPEAPQRSVGVFGSASQRTPMAPRRSRRLISVSGIIRPLVFAFPTLPRLDHDLQK